MRLELESTSKVVELEVDGARVPARLWKGRTSSGIPVHAYITRVAVERTKDLRQFEAELTEQRAPSADVAAIPMRLIL